jgi:ribonuclease VapC
MTDADGRYAYILDSSALLAAVLGEPGADQVLKIINQSAISSVNLLETFGKLIQKGIPAERVRDRLESFALPTIHWTEDDVWASADLVSLAWIHGLSLGDRVCLATARRYRARAVTTDRKWMEILPKSRILLVR